MITSEAAIADLTDDLPPERTLTAADIADLGEELAAYHAYFAPLFTRYERHAWAAVYLRGLLTADVPRKNVEAMAVRLFRAGPEAAKTVRALQPFVGEGGWDDVAILAAHRRLVTQTLGEADGILIIDGSDLPKQGTHSAGVACQWCGHTGQKDNYRAGVFLGDASRTGYTLLDRRLQARKGALQQLTTLSPVLSITDPPPSNQAPLPPAPKGLSLAEVALVLHTVLPLPTFDPAAALALLADQRQHKAAAYRSHRKRTLKRLVEQIEYHVSL